MRKYIILFTAMACLFSTVQAQKITKVYARIALGNQPWLDVENDTIYFFNAKGIDGVQLQFKFEFTNGSNPMFKDDTVFVQGLISGSVFSWMKDSIRTTKWERGYAYILTDSLSANDKIEFEIKDVEETMGDYYNIIHTPRCEKVYEDEETGEKDTIYKVPICAQIIYASNYPVINIVSTRLCEDSVLMTRPKNSDPPDVVTESVMDKVKMYPNPVTSTLTVTNLKNMHVEIYNIVGQQIVKHEDVSGDISIEMKEYSDGIYFVKIQNGKSVRTEKIKLVK